MSVIVKFASILIIISAIAAQGDVSGKKPNGQKEPVVDVKKTETLDPDKNEQPVLPVIAGEPVGNATNETAIPRAFCNATPIETDSGMLMPRSAMERGADRKDWNCKQQLNEHRYLIWLKFPKAKYTCHGTLIHPFWFVSSNRCFQKIPDSNPPISQVYVRTPGKNPEKVSITKLVRHYRFAWEPLVANDILLVKMSKTVPHWEPIRLPIRKGQTDDCRVTSVMWADRQRKLYDCQTYFLTDTSKCLAKPRIAKSGGILCGELCNQTMEAKRRRVGSYGDPMFCNNEPDILIGFYSECFKLAAFTRIDFYLDFIRSTIDPTYAAGQRRLEPAIILLMCSGIFILIH